MTNIESYSGLRERSRIQNNYPSGLPLWRYSESNFLEPLVADPELDGCQPYDAQKLKIVDGTKDSNQVILDEDPQYDPKIVELRRSVRNLRALRAQWKSMLRKEYDRQVKLCKVIKSYWHSGKAKPKWTKPWYVKQWTLRRRRVMKKVYLKPRLVAYRALISFDLSTGVKTYETRRKWILPFRWVETWKPIYIWVLKRPGMWRPVKTRVESKVRVTDWNAVRRNFAVFKLNNLQIRLDILNLRQKIIALRRDLIARPRLGASWTQSGMVTPPSIQVSVAHPYYQNPFWDPSGMELPGYTHEGQTYLSRYVYSYESWCRANNLQDLNALMSERAYVRLNAWRTTAIEPSDTALGLGDRKNVVLTPDGAALLQKATVTPEKVLRAFASLASLTKAKDYEFQIVRSAGELKDSRQTFKQAKDFLRWLRKPRIRGLTAKGAYSSIAAAYLAWKFAIQPTIQDVNTVIDNTVDYLTDIRRSLRELVNDLKSRSSIYHARTAYAAQAGLISGRTLLSCDNESFGEFEYSLEWTRHYKSPIHLCYEPSTDPAQVSDIQVEHAGGSSARSADLVVGQWGSQYAQAEVVDELDDGTQCRMFDPSTSCYATTWLDPHDDRWADSEAAFVAALQRQHIFRYPYDVRDIAVGALFASYHAGEILALVADGRIDLGTIQTFMDQSDAIASWLKNPEAQRAAVNELLKHTDRTFVAWQLTPLSFIYDWFTTSGTIVEALNSLQRMDNQVLPQPLWGLWQSERHELFSVVPNLRMRSRQVKELVREWTIVALSRRFQSGGFFLAAPARSTIFFDSIWEPSPGTAVFHRTGLYRFRRGEYLAPTGVDAYLPRLRINLDSGKLVTLSAMLGGLS